MDVKAEEIVDIIEGYKGDGHKSSKLEELGEKLLSLSKSKPSKVAFGQGM